MTAANRQEWPEGGLPHGNRQLVPAPARTLQPGDVVDDGSTVLSVTPEVGGRLHVRFEGDDTLWRMHRESVVWIRKATS